jgi:hypothetical protein
MTMPRRGDERMGPDSNEAWPSRFDYIRWEPATDSMQGGDAHASNRWSADQTKTVRRVCSSARGPGGLRSVASPATRGALVLAIQLLFKKKVSNRSHVFLTFCGSALAAQIVAGTSRNEKFSGASFFASGI